MTTTDCTPKRSTITPMTPRMTWPTSAVTVDHTSAYALVPFRGRVAAFGIENTQGTPVWRPPDW